MFRRLAALSVLAFSFAVVSYSGAEGQEKDTPKATAKSSGKSTGKSTKKNTAKSDKAPGKTDNPSK